MIWTTPLHTFKCGPCGTTVTAIPTYAGLESVMQRHADVCPGFAPVDAYAAASGEPPTNPPEGAQATEHPDSSAGSLVGLRDAQALARDLLADECVVPGCCGFNYSVEMHARLTALASASTGKP